MRLVSIRTMANELLSTSKITNEDSKHKNNANEAAKLEKVANKVTKHNNPAK